MGSAGSTDPVLLVCNKHDDTMSFVDPVGLTVLATIPVGPNPHEIVVTPDNRTAYLSNYRPPGNTISVIDLRKRKHVGQIGTGELTRIHGAAMASDGRHAYFTAGQTGYVVEIDTKTNAVTRGIPTHGDISHMVLASADGERLYTANIETRNVSVLSTSDARLIKRIPCGRGVEGIAFTPDGLGMWALNQEAGTISVIELATHTVVETFPCPGMPVRVAFTSDGKLALVPCWTENGELAVIDVETRTEVKRLAVGSQAIGVVISPDEKRAFVGCEHTDGVHVIDMATLSVKATIMTGDGSDAMAFYLPR